MTAGLSKDIQCHVQPYFFTMLANRHIKYQATSKVGYQPGDRRWSFVWVYTV